MTKEIQHFIEDKYNIGEPFYSHMIYRVFLATGMSRSQISACLNNVKKKGVITNQTTNGYGARFNHQTGRRPPKVWVRLK